MVGWYKMITIKEYLELIKIKDYLSCELDEKIKENNGFSNIEVDELTKMRNLLCSIINKLEKE